MTNFFVNLNHLSLVVVTGEDNEKFLQGQLTCDVATLENQQHCFGAACDNKGRVFASFQLLKLNNKYYLQMSKTVVNNFIASLAKYQPFYQVELSEDETEFSRFGIVGIDSTKALSSIFPFLPTKTGQVICHQNRHLWLMSSSPARYILWAEPGLQDLTSLVPGLIPGQDSEWAKLDIQAGLYHLNNEDIGRFTPELLNIDLAGGISFTKGCYTGQEIVARMHYRGTVKKRLYCVNIESKDEISIGATIYSKEEHKKLGEIITVIKTGKYTYCSLAILNTVVEVNSLTLAFESSDTTQFSWFLPNYTEL